jgi:hypothetical protein
VLLFLVTITPDSLANALSTQVGESDHPGEVREVQNFGSVINLGSEVGISLNKPIVGTVETPDERATSLSPQMAVPSPSVTLSSSVLTDGM